MKFQTSLTLALLAAAPVFSQIPDSVKKADMMFRHTEGEVPDAAPFAEQITAADLKVLIDTLASPFFQGRETGTEGQRKAANYIAEQFKALDLPKVGDKGDYFQRIFLQNDSWKNLALKIGEQEFRKNQDFYVFPASCPAVAQEIQIKDLVFVGYGIEEPGKYTDYATAKVAGKAVVFYDGEPMNTDGTSSLLTGTQMRSAWALDFRKKIKLAKQKGATFVFIVDPNLKENVAKNRRQLSTWGWRPVAVESREKSANDLLPNLFISPETFNILLGGKAEKTAEALAELKAGDKFKPLKIKAKAVVSLDRETRTLEGSNVIGFIEGSDPNLKDQYLLVTGHYDHLGMVDSSRIYFGADDNASGTASVIEIARAFAAAKKAGVGPKRSVVCMLVSGEEKGLLGSKYYTEFPLFPLENTIGNINIDMVGRVDKEHAGNPDYIYVIGDARTSNDLHKITEYLNSRHTNLVLDYKYNDPHEANHYFERSDHFNFVMKGVPATFFFNGTHEDYHKPTDTRDKINHVAAAKRAQLAFWVAWQAANRAHNLSVDFKPADFSGLRN